MASDDVILPLLPQAVKSAHLSGRVLLPTDVQAGFARKDYMIEVRSTRTVVHSSPWLYLKQVPRVIELPLSSTAHVIRRVDLVRRVSVIQPGTATQILRSSIKFSYSNRRIYLDPVSFTNAATKLPRTRTRTSRVKNRKAVTSSLRPSPENRSFKFQGYRASQYGVIFDPVVDSYVYQRTWTGVRTPGYKALKKRQLPVNGHSVNLVEQSDNGLRVWERYPLYAYVPYPNNFYYSFRPYVDYLGTAQYGGDVEAPQIEGLTNTAIRRLSSKIQDSSNLAETVATWTLTQKMLVSSFNKIRGSILALRAGNLSKAAAVLMSSPNKNRRGQVVFREPLSATKTVAENWLELQYGWKPLLNDVAYGLELIRKSNLVDWVTCVNSSASKTLDDVKLLGANDENGKWVTYGIQHIRQKATIRYGLRYRLTDPQKFLLAQTGFLSPISLAWELLPYSFVVDWLLPIGPWLESFHRWDGLTFEGGYKTVFRKKNAVYAVDYERSYVQPGYVTVYGARGNLLRETVTLSRTPLTGFPSEHAPTFKNPLSTTHALNALALLRTAFK